MSGRSFQRASIAIGTVAIGALAMLGASPGTLAAQQAGSFLPPLAPKVSGHASVSAEMYHAGNIEARRPATLWRMNSGLQTAVLGGMGMNFELLLSDEGVAYRQNVNQIGINPTWSWGGVYAGDFSFDYSRYLVRGTRVRGGGAVVDPGGWRASLQAGRLERAESNIQQPHLSYARTMVAGQAGMGALSGSFINLTFMTAWDAVSDDGLTTPDTLFLDTIPADLRPDVESRPQDNMALGFDGQLRLLDGRLTLRGEGATSVSARDREAPLVDDGSGAPPEDGPGGSVGRIRDVRISTALDFAGTVQARYQLGAGEVDGVFEYVGPGYGSLGVPYLLNDTRNWEAGGAWQLLRGRVAVQGRYTNQINNVSGQKRNTVDRNMVQLMFSLRPWRTVSLTVTGLRNRMLNDAEDDFERLDNTGVSLNTGVSWRHDLFGKRSSLGFEYGYQGTSSEDSWIGLSEVTTNRISATYRVRLSSTASIAPKVSRVVTNGTGLEERTNLRLGFTGNARFLDGRLRTTASVINTTSSGRDVFSALGQVGYPIVWGTEFAIRVRHQRYTALGQRPEFNETFFTASLSRSF